MCREENALFGQAVDNDKDSVVAAGRREVFYKVHGDGMPWAVGNGKLF
jgi:hypothetical protein